MTTKDGHSDLFQTPYLLIGSFKYYRIGIKVKKCAHSATYAWDHLDTCLALEALRRLNECNNSYNKSNY